MVNFIKEFLSFQKELEVVFWSYYWTSCAAWHYFAYIQRKKTYTTRENDASVIFQHIKLFLISQTTSKVIIRKFLINLWSL